MDMAKPATLLWMDLEMTGLDPEQDRILEVAVIATDWDFTELASYRSVVKVDPGHMKQRMVGDFWDKFNQVRSDLQVQNQAGQGRDLVESELIDFMDKNFAAGEQVVLAGNSIHQDRKFIEREWPLLDERLHYRMLDVSAWKLVFAGKFGKKFNKPEAHRAMDDIRGSIIELKYYLDKLNIKG